MRCPNCGHELENGSGFCENCGMILSLDNTGRESVQSTPTQRRKIKPNFDDDFVEYLEVSEADEMPKKAVQSEPYSYEDEQSESEETLESGEEADYSEPDDEEDRDDDTVYAQNEYYNLDRSHINSDDESAAKESEQDSIEYAFSGVGEEDEDSEYNDEDEDIRDMYVKKSKSKKGFAAVISLVVVLAVVIAVGVTVIKGNFKPAVSPGASSDSSSTKAVDAVEPTTEKTTLTEETTEEKTTEDKTTEEKTTKEEVTTKRQDDTTRELTTARPTQPSSTGSTTEPSTARPSAPQSSTTVPHTTAAITTPSTSAPAETPEKYTIANIQSKKPSKYLSSSYRAYISAHGCHMRSGPGTSYEHILYFSEGDAIKVLAKENGFLYVYAERYGVYGWVSSSLTATKTQQTEATTAAVAEKTRVISPDKTYKTPTTKKVTAAEGLKLRFGPGTDYDALRLIAKDMSVTVKGYSSTASGWVYVTVPSYGVSGWVSSAYIK